MSGRITDMGLGIKRIRQLKLPVSDLEVSARWYAALFGLENAAEFVEQDVLRGVVLADHEAGFVIGLRAREVCASKPVLAGHDIAAFELAGEEEVDALLALCDELGIRQGEIHDRGEHGVAVDVVDPDGTVLRFVAGSLIGGPGEFLGLAFDDAGVPSRYDDPRLPV
jgi:catechol 2,3-dioxygenase-like lactoylglutathione lyase family enzyme